MKNIALILASGIGSRCGTQIPKQFVEVNGQTILEHSFYAFENNNLIDEIIIVTNEEYLQKVEKMFEHSKKLSKVISGGITRKDSSFNGIRVIKEMEANVLIHDGVRPLITQQIINDCIEALKTHSAVCTTVDSVDTIFIIDQNNDINSIPQRQNIKCAQTPQCFKLSLIKDAHSKANQDHNCNVTDDCGLIINYTNSKIHTIQGSVDNIKITHFKDIEFTRSKL